MPSETPKKEENASLLGLPVVAAAVALGTVGLVAWARSSRRRSGVGPRPHGSAESTGPSSSKREASLMPEGIEGETRSIGSHILVTGPFGDGARARVYGRRDWVAALSGAVPLPEPAYEVSRGSAEAALLAAMDYVRAAEREQEES